jgi:hypothetical protein
MPTYRSSVNGAVRTTADTLGYPWIEIDAEGDPVEEQTELAAKTADATLAEVGNDAELAQHFLDLEEARETPRTSLITKLQRIVDNAES